VDVRSSNGLARFARICRCRGPQRAAVLPTVGPSRWPMPVDRQARFAHTASLLWVRRRRVTLRIHLSGGMLLVGGDKQKRNTFTDLSSSSRECVAGAPPRVRCTPVLIICHLCDTGLGYQSSVAPAYGSHKQHYDHSFGKLGRPQGSGHGIPACQKRTAIGNDTINLRHQAGSEYLASGTARFAHTCPCDISAGSWQPERGASSAVSA